jgi:hypothetical protein
MEEQRSIGRQVALVLVVFIATFALLAGGRALIGATGATEPSRPIASGAASGAIASRAPGGSDGAASGSGLPLPTFGPDPSGTVVLTGAGDIARCGSDGARQTSDLLLAQQGAFFTAGDNAYEAGTASEFASCYDPTWGRVRGRTILPVAGERDWATKGAAGYLAEFGPTAAPQGVTWYSTDIGAWHVIVLDSDCAQVGGCAATSPQGRWLANDLTTSTARCTLAIWHQPRFSSGEQGDDAQVAPFWDLLHRDGAELVINAHDRDYERFAPQDPGAREERPGGIREIVVGTGGADLGQFGRTAPNSEFRMAGTYGVLRLTLHPANYDWEFLPVTGDIADSGSTVCH